MCDHICITFYHLEAAYCFYKSKREAESLKRGGKSETMKAAHRRYERVSRVCTYIYMYVAIGDNNVRILSNIPF